MECLACSAGQYSNEATSHACKPCQNGRFQALQNATFCDLPSVGRIAGPGRTSEFEVRIGEQLVGCDGDGGCVDSLDCPGGTFGTDPPSQRCLLCPTGYYSYNGSAKCLVCEVGKIAEANGSDACVSCRRIVNEYSDTVASSSCKRCPAGRASDLTLAISNLHVSEIH